MRNDLSITNSFQCISFNGDFVRSVYAIDTWFSTSTDCIGTMHNSVLQKAFGTARPMLTIDIFY